MSEWRYIAQDARTGTFTHMDLPLDVGQLSWALSGAGQMTATCAPDVGQLRDEDGGLLLRPWGTFLYAEADGIIRWGGIVVHSDFTPDSQSWEVQAAGFATYPNGISFTGQKTYVRVDPAVPFADVWADVQSRPMSDLNVVVVADATGATVGYAGTVGDGSGPIDVGQVTDEKWAELIATEGWRQVTDQGVTRLYPPARVYRKDVSDAVYQSFIDDRWREEEKPDGAAQDWRSSFVDPPLVKVESDPYTLASYEVPDCGAKLDDLTKTAPFDYVERHWWVPAEPFVDANLLDADLIAWLKANGWYALPDDGVEALYRPAGAPARQIAHVIRVYWPRVGSRRTDLAFVQPDNIVKAVAPTVDGDDYANAVIGVGAGQGPAILRRQTVVDDGNLYREHVYMDKSISDGGRMDVQIRDELLWRGHLLDVSQITVHDHPNAPIGSWSLGDDIRVQAYVPWYGDVDLWCRITGWSSVDAHTATLNLVRSDSFRYGG